MKTHRKERNWSQYNQKLKKIARIEFFISKEAIEEWEYIGTRKPGGKKIYNDHVIEICLLMREFYKLAYRQTEGFVSSVFQMMGMNLRTPDYTTISRRAENLKVNIRNKDLIGKNKEAMVIAIDSTGLSLFSQTEWNRKKHGTKLLGYEKWRKLHIAINVKTGEILEGRYGKSTENDGQQLPSMLESIDEEISAVCGDMAYDTVNCRRAIMEKKAKALIPPIRAARISKNNRNISKYREILKDRDDAINYIQHNTINGDHSMARASWKKKSGYHARSLVETTMFQIKSHCTDKLTNKKEQTRETQALIKCKIINKILAA